MQDYPTNVRGTPAAIYRQDLRKRHVEIQFRPFVALRGEMRIDLMNSYAFPVAATWIHAHCVRHGHAFANESAMSTARLA
jgi:hypothetical protein